MEPAEAMGPHPVPANSSDECGEKFDKACQNCSTTRTPLWRKEAGELLCNACGIYFKSRGVHRPVELIRAQLNQTSRRTCFSSSGHGGDNSRSRALPGQVTRKSARKRQERVMYGDEPAELRQPRPHPAAAAKVARLGTHADAATALHQRMLASLARWRHDGGGGRDQLSGGAPLGFGYGFGQCHYLSPDEDPGLEPEYGKYGDERGAVGPLDPRAARPPAGGASGAAAEFSGCSGSALGGDVPEAVCPLSPALSIGPELSESDDGRVAAFLLKMRRGRLRNLRQRSPLRQQQLQLGWPTRQLQEGSPGAEQPSNSPEWQRQQKPSPSGGSVMGAADAAAGRSGPAAAARHGADNAGPSEIGPVGYARVGEVAAAGGASPFAAAAAEEAGSASWAQREDGAEDWARNPAGDRQEGPRDGVSLATGSSKGFGRRNGERDIAGAGDYDDQSGGAAAGNAREDLARAVKAEQEEAEEAGLEAMAAPFQAGLARLLAQPETTRLLLSMDPLQRLRLLAAAGALAPQRPSAGANGLCADDGAVLGQAAASHEPVAMQQQSTLRYGDAPPRPAGAAAVAAAPQELSAGSTDGLGFGLGASRQSSGRPCVRAPLAGHAPADVHDGEVAGVQEQPQQQGGPPVSSGHTGPASCSSLPGGAAAAGRTRQVLPCPPPPPRPPRNHKGPLLCANCGTTQTPLWRKDRETGSTMCNACGIYKQTHGIDRPVGGRNQTSLLIAKRGAVLRTVAVRGAPTEPAGPPCGGAGEDAAAAPWGQGQGAGCGRAGRELPQQQQPSAAGPWGGRAQAAWKGTAVGAGDEGARGSGLVADCSVVSPAAEAQVRVPAGRSTLQRQEHGPHQQQGQQEHDESGCREPMPGAVGGRGPEASVDCRSRATAAPSGEARQPLEGRSQGPAPSQAGDLAHEERAAQSEQAAGRGSIQKFGSGGLEASPKGSPRLQQQQSGRQVEAKQQQQQQEGVADDAARTSCGKRRRSSQASERGGSPRVQSAAAADGDGAVVATLSGDRPASARASSLGEALGRGSRSPDVPAASEGGQLRPPKRAREASADVQEGEEDEEGGGGEEEGEELRAQQQQPSRRRGARMRPTAATEVAERASLGDSGGDVDSQELQQHNHHHLQQQRQELDKHRQLLMLLLQRQRQYEHGPEDHDQQQRQAHATLLNQLPISVEAVSASHGDAPTLATPQHLHRELPPQPAAGAPAAAHGRRECVRPPDGEAARGRSMSLRPPHPSPHGHGQHPQLQRPGLGLGHPRHAHPSAAPLPQAGTVIVSGLGSQQPQFVRIHAKPLPPLQVQQLPHLRAAGVSLGHRVLQHLHHQQQQHRNHHHQQQHQEQHQQQQHHNHQQQQQRSLEDDEPRALARRRAVPPFVPPEAPCAFIEAAGAVAAQRPRPVSGCGSGSYLPGAHLVRIVNPSGVGGGAESTRTLALAGKSPSYPAPAAAVGWM